MKVLIVSANPARTPYPVYPLGASHITAALRRAGHQAHLLDFLRLGCSLEALRASVKNADPGLVGISIRNIDNVNMISEQRYIDSARGVVDAVRESTGARIVLGGSGFSLMPQTLLQELSADYGIVGEGESAVVELADEIARGAHPKKGIRPPCTLLDGAAITPADYDPETLSFYLKSGNIASIQTKRGCTHECIYCTYPLLEGRRIRPRRTSDVVDDIERLASDHGARCIFFTDSVFNDDEGRYLELVEEMRKRRLHTPWTAFFKPRNLNLDCIDLMQESGLHAAEIGADAATDETLRRLGKGFSMEDVRNCNEMFSSRGISTAHYFMFGCPGETPETVLQGIKNIKALEQTVAFVFTGIRILPGTPLACLALREGIITERQNLLEPVYYVSPKVDTRWLDATLSHAFKTLRHVLYPADVLDRNLGLLHNLGFTGCALEFLVDKHAAQDCR